MPRASLSLLLGAARSLPTRTHHPMRTQRATTLRVPSPISSDAYPACYHPTRTQPHITPRIPSLLSPYAARYRPTDADVKCTLLPGTAPVLARPPPPARLPSATPACCTSLLSRRCLRALSSPLVSALCAYAYPICAYAYPIPVPALLASGVRVCDGTEKKGKRGFELRTSNLKGVGA
eukprot:1492166-Rhodomonas_salina.1